MQYELLLLLDPELKEAEAVKPIKKIIDELKIVVKEEDVWGLRTLAYPINKKLQGRYVLYFIEVDDKAVLAQLKKELTMKEAIMRFTIIQGDK